MKGRCVMERLANHNPSRMARPLASGLLLLSAWFLCAVGAVADVIVFSDGRRFHCRILEIPDDRVGGGYRVESQGNVLWIDRSYVQSHERGGPDPEADRRAVRALLEQLIQEGRIVPTLGQQLQFLPKPPPPSTEVTLRVADVRGWAYLTQTDVGGPRTGRSRLSQGDPVPPGYTIEVSPNSRLLLNLGPAAKLGLTAGAHLRVLSVGFEPDTFVYRLEVDFPRGALWVDVLSLGGLRKVKMVIGGVQIFLNKRLVAFRVSPGVGMVIVPLSDSISLTDSSGLRVPRVSPGEQWVARVGAPGGDILSDPEWQRDLRVWNDWEAWQPEVLEMDWEPVLPPLQPRLVFETVAPVFPWEIPVDSSLIVPPEVRSLAEVISAYLEGIQAYRADTGSYPPQTDWMKYLTRDPGIPGWKGPYIVADLPRVDLWGRPLIYEVFHDGDRTFVDVRSRGPNGEDDRGLGDDIRFGKEE